jgi:hypothetical protein
VRSVLIVVAVLVALFVAHRVYVRRASVAHIYERFSDMGHVVEFVRPTSLRALVQHGCWPDFEVRFRGRDRVPRPPSIAQRLAALPHSYFVVTTLDGHADRRHLVVATRLRFMRSNSLGVIPTWSVREVGQLDLAE